MLLLRIFGRFFFGISIVFLSGHLSSFVQATNATRFNAPTIAEISNSEDVIVNVFSSTSSSTNRNTFRRSWLDILTPSDDNVIDTESDPFVDSLRYENNPFRFTEEPSIEPSFAPSSEPSVLPTSFPTPRPTIWRENSTPRNPDRSYFDYDPRKKSWYGPGQPELVELKDRTKLIYRNNNWLNVKDSAEEQYWKPLQQDIKFSLSSNACDNNRQSPIDIWPTENASCEEHHEIRHRPGDFRIDGAGDHIKKQILPTKLRLVFPRRDGDEPDPPHADFPAGWGMTVDALHADIKLPGEHMIRGRSFVGEYQLYHLHRERHRAPVISIMMDLHPNGEPNLHLQKAIDEFQQVFDADETECQEKEQARSLGSSTNETFSDHLRRNVQDVEEPRERKIWDPYHPELMTSIHFYGYSGSLTEPPCTEFIEWRVIDTPMLISPEQLLQMQILLFNHRDKNCHLTSNHFQGSVARPIQEANRRPVYQCTCRNFLADEDDRKVCSKREYRLQTEGIAKGGL